MPDIRRITRREEAKGARDSERERGGAAKWKPRGVCQDFVPSHFSFLLRAPSVPVYENPLHDWLPNKSWAR